MRRTLPSSSGWTVLTSDCVPLNSKTTLPSRVTSTTAAAGVGPCSWRGRAGRCRSARTQPSRDECGYVHVDLAGAVADVGLAAGGEEAVRDLLLPAADRLSDAGSHSQRQDDDRNCDMARDVMWTSWRESGTRYRGVAVTHGESGAPSPPRARMMPRISYLLIGSLKAKTPVSVRRMMSDIE